MAQKPIAAWPQSVWVPSNCFLSRSDRSQNQPVVGRDRVFDRTCPKTVLSRGHGVRLWSSTFARHFSPDHGQRGQSRSENEWPEAVQPPPIPPLPSGIDRSDKTKMMMPRMPRSIANAKNRGTGPTTWASRLIPPGISTR